jgi:hypothetical protein
MDIAAKTVIFFAFDIFILLLLYVFSLLHF